VTRRRHCPVKERKKKKTKHSLKRILPIIIVNDGNGGQWAVSFLQLMMHVLSVELCPCCN
jgi:hypothetical protein